MSFFTVLKTEISNKDNMILALRSLEESGEIQRLTINEAKESIEVDRDGDIMTIEKEKTGTYNVAGNNTAVEPFSKRLKQIYALQTIKENLPLDFEISEESEIAGEIRILLKG